MAARFVFALQPLLQARKREEEVNQIAFARVRRLHDGAARELQRLGDARISGAQKLFEAAVRGRARDVTFYDAHLRSLQRAAAARKRESDELDALLDKSRAELDAANRARRALEQLRERRFREFKRERARQEEMEIEEANAW